MKAFTLTQKDLLELRHWLTCDLEEERRKNMRHLKMFEGFEIIPELNQILEIGVGPLWGVLPHFADSIGRCVAVDPLLDVYYATGILAERNQIQYYSEDFITWDTNDQFDAIFCINALDHGAMGFHLLPKIANLLRPGGLLFLQVQLRRKEELNLIHDHSLTEEQLFHNLKHTDLKQEKYVLLQQDEDPPYCPAIAGVWRKPL